ncbi:hypothetical protein KCU65_g614, partial [Aureobasidium melanogenum]
MSDRHHFLVEYMTPRVRLPAGLSWDDERAHLRTQISAVLDSDEPNSEHGFGKNNLAEALTNLVRNVQRKMSTQSTAITTAAFNRTQKSLRFRSNPRHHRACSNLPSPSYSTRCLFDAADPERLILSALGLRI